MGCEMVIFNFPSDLRRGWGVASDKVRELEDIVCLRAGVEGVEVSEARDSRGILSED